MSEPDWLERYANDWERYSLEELTTLPESGGWSLSQLYDHLVLAALDYLDNVEKCAAAEEEQPLGKTDFGENLYRIGGFPPIRIKLPDGFAGAPDNSGDKERIRQGLGRISARMAQWETKLDAVNPNLKVQHGGFGWLNAREWLALVGIHFRHHLRQKAELERMLGLAANQL